MTAQMIRRVTRDFTDNLSSKSEMLVDMEVEESQSSLVVTGR